MAPIEGTHGYTSETPPLTIAPSEEEIESAKKELVAIHPSIRSEICSTLPAGLWVSLSIPDKLKLIKERMPSDPAAFLTEKEEAAIKRSKERPPMKTDPFHTPHVPKTRPGKRKKKADNCPVTGKTKEDGDCAMVEREDIDFEIEVEGLKLGVDLTEELVIENIGDFGAIPAYNAAHTDRQVQKGDKFQTVNGLAVSTLAELAESYPKEKTMKVVFGRVKEDEEEELPVYTIDEVEKHNTAETLWIAHEGFVYDLTDFKCTHPGGQQALLKWAGKDTSELGSSMGPQHPEDFADRLDKFCIAELKAECPWTQMFKAASKAEANGDGGSKRSADAGCPTQ